MGTRSGSERGCTNLEGGAGESFEGGCGGEGQGLDWTSKNGSYSLQDAQTRNASVIVPPDLATAHQRVDYKPGAGLAAQFRSGYLPGQVESKTQAYLSIPQVGHQSRPGSNHSPHASQCFPSDSAVVSPAIEPLLCRLDGHSSRYPIQAISRRVDNGRWDESQTDLTATVRSLYPFTSGPPKALPVLHRAAGVRRGRLPALRFRGRHLSRVTSPINGGYTDAQ